MARMVKKEQLSGADRDRALGRIVATSSYADLAECDLVIEAATENEGTKRRVFATLCPLLKPDAMVASNTSSISITRLAAALAEIDSAAQARGLTRSAFLVSAARDKIQAEG